MRAFGLAAGPRVNTCISVVAVGAGRRAGGRIEVAPVVAIVVVHALRQAVVGGCSGERRGRGVVAVCGDAEAVGVRVGAIGGAVGVGIVTVTGTDGQSIAVGIGAIGRASGDRVVAVGGNAEAVEIDVGAVGSAVGRRVVTVCGSEG